MWGQKRLLSPCCKSRFQWKCLSLCVCECVIESVHIIKTCLSLWRNTKHMALRNKILNKYIWRPLHFNSGWVQRIVLAVCVCVCLCDCSDHSPHAPPPPHCPLGWFAHSLLLAAAGLPAEALMNSCCLASPNPPGHCHSNQHPAAGWLPRRSPGEGSPTGNIHTQYGINHPGFLISDAKSGD